MIPNCKKQFINSESAIMVTLGEQYTTTSTSQEVLPMVLFKNNDENRFSVQDNGIRIGKGVSRVKISAQMNITGGVTHGDLLECYIGKSNGGTARRTGTHAPGVSFLTISDFLMDVSEGDIIHLRIRSATKAGAIVSVYTHMTISAITTNVQNSNATIINEEEIVVSNEEPTGENRKKVWFQKGKNLFNKNDISEGYYINTNGFINADTTTFCSNYIEVDGGKTIIKTRTNWNSIGLYDKNKTFISRTVTNENGKLVLPENCKYIRISDLIENLDIIQVEYGIEATEYELYVKPTIFIKNNNNEYEKFIKEEDIKIIEWQEIALNLKYRKIGNNVEITSNYNPNAETVNGGWITLGTLPQSYRPSVEVLTFPVLLRNSSNSHYLYGAGQILRDGTIRINQRTGSAVTIDNVMFTIIYSIF